MNKYFIKIMERKNKYFINLERNTSTQNYILEIKEAEMFFSTIKLTCYNADSELVVVMLPKYITNLLDEYLISFLNGCFLTVCINRDSCSFICITENMLDSYPNGFRNAVRVIIDVNDERIDDVYPLPFCRTGLNRRAIHR